MDFKIITNSAIEINNMTKNIVVVYDRLILPGEVNDILHDEAVLPPIKEQNK